MRILYYYWFFLWKISKVHISEEGANYLISENDISHNKINVVKRGDTNI